MSLPLNPLLGSSSPWAVVDAAYLVLKAEPSAEAGDSATARRGEVLQMLARVRVAQKGGGEVLWYGLSKDGKKAWAPADGLLLYDSREKALTAAQKLR